MKKNSISKVLAVILVLVMLVSVFSVSASAALVDYELRADDYYKIISKDDYELAPGIVESEIVLNNAAGSHRQVAHVVEVDPYNEYTKVMPSCKGMAEGVNAKEYGVQIMSEQAAYAEANGYGNVVAAMNLSLSWYDNAYYKQHPELVGEPLGYMVMDGAYYENSNGKTSGAQTCLVINFDEKDGVARPDSIPKTEIRSTSTAVTGWEEQVIPANFGFLVKNGKNQYAKNHTSDPASRSFVGIKADGTIVMVMNDGRQSPYSAGFNSYEMAEFMLSLGCVQAVNGDGGGSSAFLSQRPGRELELNCSPSDGAERPTTHGILVISTAPATGEFVRANITTEHDYYTPGSTVVFDALGVDLVGTPADIPADVTWQLADPTMGTIENGVFVSSGKVGTATAQMVYNGNVVGEASVEVVIPESFGFAQSSIVVPFNATVNVVMTATINGGLNEVAFNDEQVTLTLDNANIGTVNGLTFTAVESVEAGASLEGKLTAKLNGTNLTDEVKVKLGAPSEVLYDFETEDDINEWKTGVVNGYHTSGFKTEISYANAENGEVHNGEGALRLETNGLSAVDVSAGGYAQVPIYLKDGVIVKDALSIGFWVYIPDEYENCWIRVLYWYDSNNDGTYDKKNTITVINQPEVYNTYDESGWKYFSVDVSKYKSILIPGVNDSDSIFPAANHPNKGAAKEPNDYRFIEFMFPHTNTNDLWKTYGTINGPHTIYIDNICADYSEAVDDREEPIFKSVTMLGKDTALEKNSIATTTSNILNVTARVSENEAKSNATGLDPASAKAYVDGVEVNASYNNGAISIDDVAVADGVHRVKFEMADRMGNKAVVIRLINVNSGVDASTIEVVPADPTLDRLYGGSVYWMNVNATDIETIQSVKTVIDLNSTNHWELDHMVLADGFTSTYTIDEENNTATIVITRTGENTQTGVATLASLPIRIIYFDTDIAIKGYTAQTYWNSYDFWPYDLKVDVDMGEITYVDGYNSNVLNAFSNEEFSVDTEMYVCSGSMDAAFKAERGTAHVHTAVAADVVATCTENGYTGRTYCEVCKSVVDWGTEVPAAGHTYELVDGVLKCTCGELFNGVKDGLTYIDGVVVADGWIEIAGNTYYYQNGAKLTGSHIIEGKMCTFDENGVYNPDYLYDGFYETNGTVMYFISNNYLTGVQKIGSYTYYFTENGMGYDGEYELCGETCVFDDGKFASGTTAELMDAGWCGENVEYVIYADGLLKLGGSGRTYNYANHGNRPFITYLKKITKIEIGKDITLVGHNMFSYLFAEEVVFEEGCSVKELSTASLMAMPFLTKLDVPESVDTLGAIAFKKGTALKEINIPASVKTINDTAFKGCSPDLLLYVQEGSVAEAYAKAKGLNYTYDDFIKNGFVEEDGELYYYVDGVKWTRRGVFQVGNDFYYAKVGGALLRNHNGWASVTNDLIPKDIYDFDENGKILLKNGFFEENGELYYYVNGQKWTRRGVFQVGFDFYYAKTGGALLRNHTGWASVTNDLIPKEIYDFDENGKIQIKNGFIEEDGELYYYELGVKWTRRGVFKVGNDYYYAKTGGALLRNHTGWASVTNDLIPKEIYDFAADGKIIIK